MQGSSLATGGFSFEDIGTGSSSLQVFGPEAGYSDNVLHSQNWNRAIRMSRVDGQAFDLTSFDYGAGRWNAVTDVTVLAVFADGSTANNSLSTSTKTLSTVNAAGTFANPNSNVVLVGNNSTWDNIGAPELRPGLNDPHSCIDVNGNLYVASGDGGSFGRVDPINLRALDIDSLAGKIFRIDPITGEGVSDNPFYNGDLDANQSKVFV